MINSIGIVLSGLPLKKSCMVQEDGSLKEDSLVWALQPGEVTAILKAKELQAKKITVFSFGAKHNQCLTQQALALGGTEAVHIGALDWPHNLDHNLVALALKPFLANEDLVFMAELGTDKAGWDLPLGLSFVLNCPGFGGVMSFEPNSSSGYEVVRKLEKGKRQKFTLSEKGVIGFLPKGGEYPQPSLANELRAKETKVKLVQQSYSLLRTVAKDVLPQPVWQVEPVNPQTKSKPKPDGEADQRLEAFVTGFSPVRRSTLVEGSPRQGAEAIIDFLLKQEIIVKN